MYLQMDKLGVISIERPQVRNTDTWNLIVIHTPAIGNIRGIINILP